LAPAGDLSALTNLQQIDFSYNQLRSVPAHVRRLPRIRELSVQGNPMAAFNIPAGPAAPAG
jgi:Leucine-rich repeat (LRR) protein